MEGQSPSRKPPKAWGETRYTWGTTPTTYRYTGQREQAELGLYYYGARWYDPALARFTQPDTIVPEPGDPQGWNRFSYVKNNPLRYQDPTGHREEEETGADASASAPSAPGGPNGPQDVGGGGGGGGGGVLWWILLKIAQAICGDGDCTNEARAAADMGDDALAAAKNVWKLDPLMRGQELHRMLGQNLPNAFRTVDIWDEVSGTVTSIKTLNTAAPTYQNAARLFSTVQGYIDEVAQYAGGRMGGREIVAPEIMHRQLLLAIPPTVSEAQISILQQLQVSASYSNVGLYFAIVAPIRW